jgi:carboxypeptidase Taq
MTEAVLEEIFDRVRPRLTRLLDRITTSSVYSGIKRLDGRFPIQTQAHFGRNVLTAIGFDWNAGRLDESPHPFCTGLSPHDVRITTRYSEDDFSGALFGTIHEGGHALYEQGLDPAYIGLPVCEAISLGIHESQSRLWENQVGRSRAFWSYWLPRLKAAFPDQLENTTLDELVFAVNLVKASPLRVTADEVTYGLHIIVRFELERALLNKDLDVKSLPEAWNSKMESYLGIRPKNDSEGVLQDIHWSHGLIGYFPTYLLGNLYSAQLMDQARRDIRNFDENVASGDFMPLRDWLRKNVHSPGKTLTAEKLIAKLTGQPLNSDFFLEYLEGKFGDLYEL